MSPGATLVPSIEGGTHTGEVTSYRDGVTEWIDIEDGEGVRRFSRHTLERMGPDGRVAVGDLVGDPGPFTHISFESADASYRASIPMSSAVAGGVIIHADSGGPLDPGDGGPFRLIVTDGDTACWNVKGVAVIRLTVGPEPDSVPPSPSH